MNGGKENAILGHPWLEAVNPIINWKKGMITLPPKTDKSLTMTFSHLAERASYLSKNTHLTTSPPSVNPHKETIINPDEQIGLC